ncbi:hypothetical protein [Dermacoccus nishinomiyaensis]|uniref:hypothetical protein n=1 Tax=Dermacoccus nishinomiyaensis TaxID=1274 RepID=UPI0033A47182
MDVDGDLWRHFGRSDGKIAADECKIGFGWKTTRLIARARDIDKDGDDDLYAIDTTGVLRFNPDDRASELFTRAPTTVGHNHGGVNQLAVSPDLDSDTNPDLLLWHGDGRLTRASTTATGGIGPSTVLTVIDSTVYDTVLAPGDLTGNGLPDVLARTQSGDLYRYTRQTGGTLASPVKTSTGWNILTTILTPGNIDGDLTQHSDTSYRW